MRRAERGIALILVLWVVALMVLFASAFSVSVRGEARLTFAESERIRAGVAAEAGVRRALLELLATSAATRTSPSAETRAAARQRRRLELVFDGTTLDITIVPESAFIDINVAPEPLVRGVVASAAAAIGGRSEAEIDAAVDSILDWRDVDSRRRASGAERAEYERAGRPGPQDQPFMSVSELSQVVNVDRALLAALRPLVTVYSFSPQIDPLVAAGGVLAALPGADAASVEAVLELREAGAPESEIVAQLTESRRYLARRPGATYTVLVRAVTAGGVTAARRAVVKVNPRAQRPVAILAWFHDAGGQPLAQDATPSSEDATPPS